MTTIISPIAKQFSRNYQQLAETEIREVFLHGAYCGHVINGSGIKPVAAKVEAIQNAPAPENVTQLRAFLGMLNCYHRFLPHIATVLAPLHKLLRQDTTWCWENEQQRAFEAAKKRLQSAELLEHFQPDLELILASDASDYGVGAVLSHRMADGTERSIACFKIPKLS